MTDTARQTRKLGKAWRIVFAVGFLMMAGLVSFFILFRTFQIPSGSMMPTLLPGDHVFVRMWRFGTPSPRRGDLVVYQSPEDSSRLLFHRVVALPGDHVEVVTKHLRINGREVQEPYAVHLDARTYGSGEGPIALRDNSYDSRFFGPIPRELLRGGRDVIVYFSVDPKTGEPRSGRMGRRLH